MNKLFNRLALRYDEFKRIKRSQIQLIGSNFAIIDGVKKIISMDENVIKVELAENSAVIDGLELETDGFSDERTEIRGKIKSITFY